MNLLYLKLDLLADLLRVAELGVERDEASAILAAAFPPPSASFPSSQCEPSFIGRATHLDLTSLTSDFQPFLPPSSSPSPRPSQPSPSSPMHSTRALVRQEAFSRA